MGIIVELWRFVKERKKWWLVPVIIVLLVMGLFILFVGGSAISPFIYTLF